MLTKYNRTIVATNSGAVVPEAVVEFRYQFTGALAPVYSDVNGSNAILNPTTADLNGFVGVFLNPGIYRIIARQVPGGPVLQELTYELVINSTVADPQAISALGLNPHGIENISILFEPEAEGLYVNVASRLGAPFSNENYSTVSFRTPEVDQDSTYVVIQIDEPLEVLLENSIDFGIGATGQEWMFVYLVWDGDEVHVGLARKTTHDEGVDHTTLDFSSNDVDRILTDGAISTPCTIRLIGRFVATRSSGNWSSVLTPSSYQSETTFITNEARKLLGDSGDFQFSGNVDVDGTISSGGSLVLTEDQVGVPNGIASLNALGQIPSGQLPSYVDDVLEFADFASLPVTGEAGKIYITVDDNEQYRWTGSVYVQLVASPGTTDNVPEGSTNLYFTQSRVRSTPLTGFVAGVGLTAVLATDTVLQAFQKLQGWLNGLGTAALANVTTSPSDTTSGRLWRTNDLVKVTSPVDITAGSVTTVGYAGWGGVNSTAIKDANSLNVAAAYQLDIGAPETFTNFPTWAQPSRSTFITTGNKAPYSTDLYFDRTLNRAAFRTWSTTANPWVEFWTTANLVKTTSPTDNTAGSMMQVGDGGLLGNSIQVANLNNIAVNEFITGSSATSTNRPANVAWWVGMNMVRGGGTENGQIVIGTSSDTGLYYRARYNATPDTYFPWHRVWDDANLVKTTSATDTTAGSMLKVGDGGILVPITLTGQNLNLRRPTAFYYAQAPASGPSGNSGWLLQQDISAAYNTQTFVDAVTGNYYHRTLSNSVQLPWRQVWDDSNLVKTASHTDENPGRMLQTGDAGLLENTVMPGADWDVDQATTFFYGGTNAPAGGFHTGFKLRGENAGLGRRVQVAIRQNYYWREGNIDSGLSAWKMIWDTGNTSAEVQYVLGGSSVWASLATQSSEGVNASYVNASIESAITNDPATVKNIRQTVLSASISLASVHNGRHIVKTNTSAYTITLQLNSSVSLPIGFNVTIINDGSAGNITISRISGVVMRMAGNATDANRVIAPYGQATLIKIATDTWRIVGVGVS